ESYVQQFGIFIDLIEPGGKLVYCAEDPVVKRLAEEKKGRRDVAQVPYGIPPHEIRDGVTFLQTAQGEVRLNVFGQHNLMNLEGARHVCHQLGIGDRDFYAAIASFTGAAKRLEKLAEHGGKVVFKDFAHSPSKLKATVDAVREQFPDRKLTACMELHTFSSLSDNFLDQYAGCMDAADTALVFYDPHAVQMKRLPAVPVERIRAAFARKDLRVLTDPTALMGAVREDMGSDGVLLMMSSGNFGGMDLNALAEVFIA
ncbi:MAG: peptidoglycan synthetase, partial [Flavobacteriales bacterium]